MQLSQVSVVAAALAAFFAVSTAAPAPQPPQVEVRQAPLSFDKKFLVSGDFFFNFV